MADSSSSEEYVSADEGPEDLQTATLAHGSRTTTPPSGSASSSPSNLRVTPQVVEVPIESDQRQNGQNSLDQRSKEEIPIACCLDNNGEPHPPLPPSSSSSSTAVATEDLSSRLTDGKHSAESALPKTNVNEVISGETGLNWMSDVDSIVATSSTDASSDVALTRSHDKIKSESIDLKLNTDISDVNVHVDSSGERITERLERENNQTAINTIIDESRQFSVEKEEGNQRQLVVVGKRKKEREQEEKQEKGLEEVRDEEKAPVPPPRRKRKKKLLNKPPSLENLVDTGSSSLPETDASLMQRSMTVSSMDYRRETKREKQQKQQQSKKMAAQDESQPAAFEQALLSSDSIPTSPETILEGDGRTDTASPSETTENDVEVKSKPIKTGDGPLDRSLRSSRSATPTPAISIEPDGSLELTADMINGIDNEVITSDTLQSAKARGSNNTGFGVIIPSDDESVDGEALLLGEEDEEEQDGGGEIEGGVQRIDGGAVGGAGMGGADGSEVGGALEGVAIEMLPGNTPQRPRAVSKTSEEGNGSSHDHEKTPQPCDHHEKTLELAEEPTDQQNAGQSGSPTDNAILESTMIKNLDTGEVMPLSAAEERIPRGHGWSPLSEHLLRRTNQMTADGHLPALDEDEMEDSQQRGKIKKRLRRLTKWGKRKGRHGDGHLSLDDDTITIPSEDHQHAVKYKNSSNKQGHLEFERVRLKQDLTGQHLGAVWSMEFSICGRLLATAGQDSVVRVWVLRTAYHFFHELQSQYQRLGVHSSVDSLSEKASMASNSSKSSEEDDASAVQPFLESPLCAYYGHTADILDLSWSKNFFLLSSSMDKTVRLWHISRKECLCCFQHVDFVTAIAFHPRDDRYFLSGSLDGKLRLWNIPDKKVALWNEIEGVGSHLITAANFCMNGKLAVVGTYDGRCIFYETEHLKYHTQIHVRSRHGKNRGRKISGVEPLPGEDKLLVTSNDSRIRLYNLKDHSLSCKYRGCLNTSSQIKATFSRDGQYIISGSEDNFVYVWKTHIDLSKMPSRRDRNEFYESFSTHSAPVTTAVFAPVPGITVDQGLKEVGEMIVAADYQGCIKIYVSNENL